MIKPFFPSSYAAGLCVSPRLVVAYKLVELARFAVWTVVTVACYDDHLQSRLQSRGSYFICSPSPLCLDIVSTEAHYVGVCYFNRCTVYDRITYNRVSTVTTL